MTALLWALVGIACTNSERKPPPPASRVNAVVADPAKQPKLEDFCEIHADAASAPRFTLPTLVEGQPETQVNAPGQWRWINVWATWCKPCIEEIPLIESWRERFAKESIAARVVYLSVDAEADAVAQFRSEHPALPATLRIADAAGLGAWLTSLGLEPNSVLPIHMFVDDRDRLRCVRMGGVAENDFDMVRRVLQQKT